MTGNVYEGRGSINERQAEIDEAHARYWQIEEPLFTPTWGIEPLEPLLTDEEVLSVAMSATNCFKFAALWEGDISGHGNDASGADMALCSLLAFYCRRNAEQIDRLFRRSELYREEKWDKVHRGDGATYGEMTIARACATTVEVYGGNNKYEPGDYTDVGNARAFERTFKGKALYCKHLGWLVWTGDHWSVDDLKAKSLAVILSGLMLKEASEAYRAATAKFDTIETAESGMNADEKELSFDTAAVIRQAKNTVESRFAQAKNTVKRADAYRKHALKTRQGGGIANMLDIAKVLMTVELEAIDANPFDLNSPAGIVDLRTGAIKPHDPDRLCAKITKCPPGDKGKKLWHDFLDVITCGDAELKAYHQQVAGMAAIGKVFYESLIIAWGDGGNGKSTLYNAIAAVLGSYSHSINAEILTTGNQNKQYSLAELRGQRLVIAAELEDGKRLSISILKQIASTDRIAAEKKYKDPMSFTPSHSLILYTNHLPKVGTSDKGTWRRLIVVPFNAKIAGGANDIKNYGAYLAEEAGEAIMQWIIDGAAIFVKNGFDIEPPQVVKEAIDGYRAENDWLARFIDDCCIVDERKHVKAQNLYQAYRDWAAMNGDFIRSHMDFPAEMERKGYDWKKTMHGKVWFGVALDTEKNQHF